MQSGILTSVCFLAWRGGRCCCSVANGEIWGSPRPHIIGQNWLYVGGWQLPCEPAHQDLQLSLLGSFLRPLTWGSPPLCTCRAGVYFLPCSFSSLLLCPFSFSCLLNNCDLQPQMQIPFPMIFRSFTISLIITFGFKTGVLRQCFMSQSQPREHKTCDTSRNWVSF